MLIEGEDDQWSIIVEGGVLPREVKRLAQGVFVQPPCHHVIERVAWAAVAMKNAGIVAFIIPSGAVRSPCAHADTTSFHKGVRERGLDGAGDGPRREDESAEWMRGPRQGSEVGFGCDGQDGFHAQ